METVKPPLSPIEQLYENYSLSLGIYQSRVVQEVIDPEHLSIVSELIRELKAELRSSIGLIDDPQNSANSQKINALNLLFLGRQSSQEAWSDPLFEDFIFSFPSTFKQAFVINPKPES